MTSAIEKKIVIFGAGKIGRSFIGQVFSRSGYVVVFADIDRQLVEMLNQKQSYRVVIKSNEANEVIQVTNVRGICLDEKEKIVEELAGASIAAISVGQQGLQGVLPLLAAALQKRRQVFGRWPLDVIIAENMRNADVFINSALTKLLPVDYPVHHLVGLVETSIGKMVPIMTKRDLEEDPLQVFAEPYNSLIVAKNGFKNPVPDIEFLAPKENIKAWVDRKLFIHNLGHATAAYLGYQKNPVWKYIHEALADHEIFSLTRKTMLQSANILMALHPGEFSISQLEAHIDDLLIRFQNKALGDTIFRVGCDLYRKLSPDDRLAGPIHAAIKLQLPYNCLLDVVKAAGVFAATGEDGHLLPADEQFHAEMNKDVAMILERVCKIKLY